MSDRRVMAERKWFRIICRIHQPLIEHLPSARQTCSVIAQRALGGFLQMILNHFRSRSTQWLLSHSSIARQAFVEISGVFIPVFLAIWRLLEYVSLQPLHQCGWWRLIMVSSQILWFSRPKVKFQGHRGQQHCTGTSIFPYLTSCRVPLSATTSLM